MENINLNSAKIAKQDEFYTQYKDIQTEVNAYLEYDSNVFRDKSILLPCDDPSYSNFTKFFVKNFNSLGLKKLVSTSYTSKKILMELQPSLFESESSVFSEDKAEAKGKIFMLTKDRNEDGNIDIDNLQWAYMKGDGDFRSEEVKKLRDEADIIITNPPFSLFREFLSWIFEAKKKFLIIGNMNVITYKEVFPLIMNNKIWLGVSIHSGDREFQVPNNYVLRSKSQRVDDEGRKFVRVSGVRWFTNLDHGRRHKRLSLMSMEDNIKFNKKLKGKAYQKYDDYDAIEVPFTDAIPSDYFEKDDFNCLTKLENGIQFITEQNRTEQNRTEQNRTEQ
ncbi:MAG: adenine-specific methyltransferase EcoRI family protein, partial [Treponema sp.]